MRALVCTSCRCTLESIEVANGRAMVICIACEGVGNADEIALGAALTAFEQPPRRRKREAARKPARTAELLDTH
jgi:hypothetical protein